MMILDLLHGHGYQVRLHPRYPYGEISAGNQQWVVAVKGETICSATPWLQQWADSVDATAVEQGGGDEQPHS